MLKEILFLADFMQTYLYNHNKKVELRSGKYTMLFLLRKKRVLQVFTSLAKFFVQYQLI